ncbi:MAG: DUF1311 domain-containing protein [Fibrobacterota bacterium]|nr:DUF1311 domain-containing protein [Fibrobacterota bacterium]QQS04405.1 MAG: DUF1311 domain-containing protein [Fibrobacterota bacterium]
MNSFSVASVGLLLASSLALAEEKADPIDLACSECQVANPTTMGMLECQSKAYEAWDARLNKVYQRVRGHLDPEGKKDLQAAQRDWLKFRDGEFKWTRTAYGKMEGSIYSLYIAQAKLEVVRSRVRLLQSFVDAAEESH